MFIVITISVIYNHSHAPSQVPQGQMMSEDEMLQRAMELSMQDVSTPESADPTATAPTKAAPPATAPTTPQDVSSTASPPSAPPAVPYRPLQPGERCVMIRDAFAVEQLQDSHGGWNEQMEMFLGAEGVVKLVDSDGDLRVQFTEPYSRDLCLHPKAVRRPDEPEPELFGAGRSGSMSGSKSYVVRVKNIAGLPEDMFVEITLPEVYLLP